MRARPPRPTLSSKHSQTIPFHHPKETSMTDNPNELTIENSVLVLIDHQPAIAFAVHSIDHGVLIDNVAGLARAAKDLRLPTVLTTVGAQGSVLVDPIFKEISEVFPEVAPRPTRRWTPPRSPTRCRSVAAPGGYCWITRWLK